MNADAVKNLPHPKKVVVIGPECTGKSELSEFLAKHYNTVWVPEYARQYLGNLRRPYQEGDLVKIAHGQIRSEDEWLSDANKVLICDTNLTVIKVWSEHKFGKCEAEILRELEKKHYDLFLLTYIDVPWQDDPQREQPDKREYFFEKFKQELSGQSVVEIRGDREQRRATAIQAIDNLLKS